MAANWRMRSIRIKNPLTLPGVGLRRVCQISWAQITGLVFSNEILSLTDQAVVSAANFSINVIIGRSCTQEEFGLYMLGFSILLILLPMQTSLILGPYSVFCPRLKGIELCHYTGSTLIHQVALSGLLAIALAAAGGVLSFGIGPQGLAAIVWTLAVTITLVMFREYARQVSMAHLSLKAVLILDIGVAIFQVICLLTLAHLGILSATKAFWVTGTACGLAGLGWVIYQRRDFTLKLGLAVADFWRNWSFGKWLLGARLVHLGSNQLYPWLLVFFYGTAATGVLAACTWTIYLANPFLLGMSNYLGPKTAHAFASAGAPEVRRIVIQNSLIFLAVMGPFCAVMLVFGDQILGLLYGPKYSGHGLLVGVLALSQLALALTLPTNAGLAAIERPDVGLKSSLVALGSMLTLGLCLVKWLGPLGVGFGLLAGNLAISTFRWVVFNRECPATAAEAGK
jgi:O-antigen/teichoic acid export membrane protein